MTSQSSPYLSDYYDLCVIGGGINGAGIARDAAGRGLSVLLLEAGDLAQATSSASTKLIHGGLRYLEQFQFRLVAESLAERQRLLKAAPHIVHPIEFILPHEPGLRPAWMIRLGLFIYDHMKKGGFLPVSGKIRFDEQSFLQQKYKTGFSYWDCWTDDARLVLANAQDAARRGADIHVRTTCTKIQPLDKGWEVSFQDNITDNHASARCGVIVNAAGPWVRDILDKNNLVRAATPGLRLVKGSHIIVSSLYPGQRAAILQQPDGRVVFTIPFEKDYTLIGTTDSEYRGDASDVKISPWETEYLCAAVNRSLKAHITAHAVLWSYSGVRSLLDSGDANPSKVTRDYKIHLEDFRGSILINIFGGKLTTYRKLAEQTINTVCKITRQERNAWTETAILPGGDIQNGDFASWIDLQAVKYGWLPAQLVQRYARSYGTYMDVLLQDCSSINHMGVDYGDHIFEREIRYMIRSEWARTCEDILWRRSKLGLSAKIDTVAAIEAALPRLLKEELNGP